MAQVDQTSAPVRPGAWTGYAAALWAFAFAVPSLVWGMGIHLGVRSVGRELASYTWSSHPGFLALVLATGFLKVVGGLFALALVRPSWPLPPRRLTIAGGYAVAGLLIPYGLQDIVFPLLLETGVIAATSAPDWYAIRWHLTLWGPVFLSWGLLLALAVRHYQGTSLRR